VKNFFALAVLVALPLGAMSAQAQTYGQYGGAAPIPSASHLTGVYLNASDNLFGVLGQLRLSFYPGVDFGFQGGIARTTFGSNNRTTLRLGTDFKARIRQAGQNGPFDMAMGANLGVETGDGYDILRLGPTFSISTPVPFGQNSMFVPYAGIGISFNRLDTQLGQTTDFGYPLRMGGELRFMPEFRFMAEMQINIHDDINDSVEAAAGINLPF
jgi:opacity protein-like surface antigen